MATEDDKINTGALATVVAVGALGMIGVSLAVNALVRHEVGTIGAERDATGEVAYHSMKDAQLKKLSGPSDWTDRAKGQVSVPIDRAMGLVLADLKRSPWNASPAPPPDAGAPVDLTLPGAADAGATEGDGGAGAPPNNGTADAGPTMADAGPAEPPAGSALSPSAPVPPTSAKPAPAPGPSAAPPKPRAPVAPTAAAPAPPAPAPAPAPAAPASPTPPANP